MSSASPGPSPQSSPPRGEEANAKSALFDKRGPLAILGGTFDPIHLGHLNAAWEAAELLDTPVHLLPAAVPPHRQAPRASGAQRVALLEAALAKQARLSLDARELARSGPSYTIDTLEDLRAEQGDQPLILLLGADAFAGLPTWHRWRELLNVAHIGVMNRPGIAISWPEALQQAVAGRVTRPDGAWRAAPAGQVIELSITPLDISATRVRELLAAGRDPRFLLPCGLFDQPDLLKPYRY